MSQQQNFLSQLTLEDISSFSPTKPIVSKNYQVFNTGELVQSLLDLKVNGEKFFRVRAIFKRKLRKNSSKELALRGTHMVRVATVKPIEGLEEELYPELVITNSYDTSSALAVRMGIFRLVCENGVIIATHDLGKFRLRHTGAPQEQAIELLKDFAKKCRQFVDSYKMMILVQLSPEQIEKLAKEAATIRFKPEELEGKDVMVLNKAIRPEDEGNDVWHVFNRFQGHLIQGGERLGRKKMRPILRAGQDIRINEKLFKLFWDEMHPAGYEPIDPATIPEQFTEVAEVLDIEPAKTIRGAKGHFQKNPEWLAWQERQFVNV